jgi:hypothetical protein
MAGLVFRVGVVDEHLPVRGFTHMVEHLALSSFRDTSYYCNGAVGLDRTTFVVRGDVDEVVGHIRALTSNLSSLPVGRLEVERKILSAESSTRNPGAVGDLLEARFGPNGPGLLEYAELGLPAATTAAIQEWARRFFTRGNLAVWLTGPPVPQIDLNLPEGERNPLPSAEPLELPLPGWAGLRRGGTAMGMLTPRSTVSVILADLLRRKAMAKLRYDLGIVYDVASSYLQLDNQSAHLALVAETEAGNYEAAAVGLHDIAQNLAAGRFDQQEIVEYQNRWRRTFEDPAWTAGWVDALAHGELIGKDPPSPVELDAEISAVSTADVGRAMHAAMRTAILVGPPNSVPAVDGYQPLPRWSTTRAQGKRYKHRYRRRWRTAPEVQLDGEAITLAINKAQAVTVRFADCVASCHYANGTRILLGPEGRFLPIDPFEWEAARELVSVIDQRVPSERWIAIDKDVTPPRYYPIPPRDLPPPLWMEISMVIGVVVAVVLTGVYLSRPFDHTLGWGAFISAGAVAAMLAAFRYWLRR